VLTALPGPDNRRLPFSVRNTQSLRCVKARFIDANVAHKYVPVSEFPKKEHEESHILFPALILQPQHGYVQFGNYQGKLLPPQKVVSMPSLVPYLANLLDVLLDILLDNI
jgi:hypothetical protein